MIKTLFQAAFIFLTAAFCLLPSSPAASPAVGPYSAITFQDPGTNLNITGIELIGTDGYSRTISNRPGGGGQILRLTLTGGGTGTFAGLPFAGTNQLIGLLNWGSLTGGTIGTNLPAITVNGGTVEFNGSVWPLGTLGGSTSPFSNVANTTSINLVLNAGTLSATMNAAATQDLASAASLSSTAATLAASIASKLSGLATMRDVVRFSSLRNVGTLDFVGGVFTGSGTLDSTDGVTNVLYSTVACAATNTSSAQAFAKLMVPLGVTNLTSIGLGFRYSQGGGNPTNFIIRLSHPSTPASVTFTGLATSANANVTTNFPTAGTFLTNNLAGSRLELRWEISMSSTSGTTTAERGISFDWRWNQ